jgi:Fanconi-associated nuclease 1
MKLKVPEDERHVCEGSLKVAEKRTIEAVRVHKPREQSKPSTSEFFRSARGVSLARNSSDGQTEPHAPGERNALGKWSANPSGIRSKWRSKDGSEEIGVEEVALEYYESLGFRG